MSKKKAPPHTTCPACGTPHIESLFGVMVFFPNVKERNDFVELAKKELKSAVSYPVYHPTKNSIRVH